MMIHLLPEELIRAIAEWSSLSSQASLALSCRRLRDTCSPILFRNDIRHHGASSVFYAIVYCLDDDLALRILEAARTGGADFSMCCDGRRYRRSRHGVDPAQHSPIRLAARRGLDVIVSFLIDYGVCADGTENENGSRMTPLLEAIINNHESTAMLLIRRGAQKDLRPPKFIAFRAAVRYNLPNLTKCIVERHGVDVNADVGHGCTPMNLAICCKSESVIPVLLELGANVVVAMRAICRNHTFLPLLWTLRVGSVALRESLSVWDLLHLAVAIATEKVSPIQQGQQMRAMERVLEVLEEARKRHDTVRSETLDNDLRGTLDGLLQLVLSVARADGHLVSPLLRSGARFQVGVFIELLQILNSTRFRENRSRCLRQYPKLLQCFDLVYSYCIGPSPQASGFLVEFFIQNVPEQAVQLVAELKQHDLPLTYRGLEAMEHREVTAMSI